jgi:lipoprotein-anchoring transpeptidase ErfK/SrfK
MTRAVRAALVAVAVVAGAVLAVALRGGGDAPARPSPAAAATLSAADLPATPKAAFAIGKPVPLERHAHETTWAAVRATTTARRRPSTHAPAATRIPARTPEDTTNIVLPLARHGTWIRISEGWVPRSALGTYGEVRTQLVVDLSAERATLLRDGKPIMHVPVGTGTAQAPTPTGHFVIRNRLTRYRSPFYGPVALGTSARTKLTDWPGGGFVGIHGTDEPQLIPGHVSHGCIRMHNEDIVKLARLAPVGTPLTIRA